MRSRWLNSRRVPLLAAFVIVASCVSDGDAAAVERSSGWGQYRDKGAGLVFDMPAHISPLDSAREGRVGTVFTSRDGRAQVRVFGSANEANDTPQQYLNRIARGGDRADFSYVRTTPTFFVASGARDGVISYRRCNFSRAGKKRIGCIQLNYPQRDKRAWDAPVTRMSRSLRLVARD
jgi:hypothetical protein